MKKKATTSRFRKLALVMALSWPVMCFGQVTSNVLLRTLLIAIPSGKAAASVPMGTAFTIDLDGREYLITAKHVVGTLNDGAKGTIAIKTKAGWSPERVTVFKCKDPVDIAVLIPPTQLTVDFPLEASSIRTQVGQDVYFVGFPNGGEHAATYPNMPYVSGFVKRATLEQFVGVPEPGTKEFAQQIWLDGINNPGFSGSPVVYRDFSKSGVAFNVAGVIVAYEWNPAPVLRKVGTRPDQITARDREKNDVVWEGGKPYRLEDTGEFVEQNTGMAIAWDIRSAVKLIKQHPLGPSVSDQFQPRG